MKGKYRTSKAARKIYVVALIVLIGIWGVIETKSYITSPAAPHVNDVSETTSIVSSAARKLLSGVEIIPGFNGGKCGSHFYYTAQLNTPVGGEYRPGDTVSATREEWESWTEPGGVYPPTCKGPGGINVCLNPKPYQTWESDSGGILYVILAIYLFLGIAIICDGAFTDSLEMICSRYGLGLSEDVAGATFMAAGSSAPELATSFLGTFVAESGVGLGTILGSAVFNILIIVGAVAFLSNEPLKLDYRPIIRDNFFYVTSVILLCILLATDNEASLVDSAILCLWYALYIIFLAFNDYFFALLFPAKDDADGAVVVIEEEEICTKDEIPEPNKAQPEVEPERESPDAVSAADVISGMGAASVIDDVESELDVEMMAPEIDIVADVEVKPEAEVELELQSGDGSPADSAAPDKGSGNGSASNLHPVATQEKGPEEEPEEEEEEKFADMSCLDKILFILSWPFEMIFKYTMPDCHMDFDDEVEDAWREEYSAATSERKKQMKQEMWAAVEDCGPKWFWATFAVSLVHISWLAYFMVEFMLKIGCIWGIPDVLMGLTFLAAGTSIPDALGSVSVAKEGKGDMAVSNAVGSNVFDICVGLGFPWLIKLLIDVDKTCNFLVIYEADKEVVPTIVILMSIIVIMFSTFFAFNWVLDPKAGYVYFSAYFVFFIYCFLNQYVFLPTSSRCNLPCCK